MVNTSDSFLMWKLLHAQALNIKGWQGTLRGGRVAHFVLFFSDLPDFCSVFSGSGRERMLVEGLVHCRHFSCTDGRCFVARPLEDLVVALIWS